MTVSLLLDFYMDFIKERFRKSKALLNGAALACAILVGTSGCSQGFGGIRYTGGDGSSIEKAIVIAGAKDDEQGTLAEHRWLKSHYRGFTTGTQGMIRHEGRLYDEISFENDKGQRVSVYFDITDFQGKSRSQGSS